jgi:hypothetical protein
MGGSPIVLGIAPGVFWFASGIQSVSYWGYRGSDRAYFSVFYSDKVWWRERSPSVRTFQVEVSVNQS